MAEEVKSFAQFELISVEQLAVVIHKSPSSIRSDASRKPDSLPPICRLPGTKRLLWRSEDVSAWLAQFVQRSEFIRLPMQCSSSVEPKRRGRPRKTELRSQA